MIEIDSPIGPVRIEAGPDGVSRVRVGGGGRGEAGAGAPPANRWEEEAARAVRRYFDGERDALDGLAVDLPRVTPLRRRIYDRLRAIPFGETRSYGELAREAGRPGAARAVGTAMAENPVPLIQPCHRVIAAGGRIGGFSPSLAIKRWLLRHEEARVR